MDEVEAGFIKRLEDFMHDFRLNNNDLASKTGVSKQQISHVLTGRSAAGTKIIFGIASGFPDLNMNWLFRGNGPMRINEDEIYESEEEIISIMKILDAHNARLSRIENSLGFAQDSIQ